MIKNPSGCSSRVCVSRADVGKVSGAEAAEQMIENNEQCGARHECNLLAQHQCNLVTEYMFGKVDYDGSESVLYPHGQNGLRAEAIAKNC